MYRLITCPNFKFLALVIFECNRHGLFLRAERACPDASKFESFIPLVPLVFELELFKPKISISFFGSETHMA